MFCSFLNDIINRSPIFSKKTVTTRMSSKDKSSKSKEFVDNDWSTFKSEISNLIRWSLLLLSLNLYCYFRGSNEYLAGPNASSSNDLWLKLISIWPYDIRLLYAILGYAFNVIPFLSVCIYYDIIYKYKIFESYRIQSPYTKYPDKDLVANTVKYDLFLELVIAPLSFFFTFNVNKNFDPTPNLWTITWQILAGIYTFDIGFYITHRLLHTKALYKYHKLHHEYKTSISWTAIYSSTFELVIGNIPPTALPLILYKMHPVTALLYYMYRQIETAVGHSGYDLPFYLSPLGILKHLPGHCDQERFHDFHHSHNDGCYGFYFIDALFGTHKTYRKYLHKNRQEKSIKKEE